jgi:hypothetical protein
MEGKSKREAGDDGWQKVNTAPVAVGDGWSSPVEPSEGEAAGGGEGQIELDRDGRETRRRTGALRPDRPAVAVPDRIVEGNQELGHGERLLRRPVVREYQGIEVHGVSRLQEALERAL